MGGGCRRTLIIYNKMPLQDPAQGSDSTTSTVVNCSPISSLRSFAALTQVYSTTSEELATSFSDSTTSSVEAQAVPSSGGAQGRWADRQTSGQERGQAHNSKRGSLSVRGVESNSSALGIN